MTATAKKSTIRMEECHLTFKPDLHGCDTLEQVKLRLQANYSGWFVYMGGHHVALHRKEGDNERLLLIVEE